MTDLLGIPILKTEVVGLERPFCQLIDNAAVDSKFNTVRLPGQYIFCNSAGLELLKKEIERRNKEGT